VPASPPHNKAHQACIKACARSKGMMRACMNMVKLRRLGLNGPLQLDHWKELEKDESP
jgi:hypothetical protein